MRKLFLSLLAVFAFGFVQAQESGAKFGVNIGAPVGDASDFTSISFGADLAYLWSMGPAIDVGLSVGYLNYAGKKTEGVKRDNIGFVPVAATGQFSILDNLYVGADLGYAIGVSPDANKGGFYYLPKIGYQIDLFEVYLGYKGISNKFKYIEYDGFSLSESVNVSSVVLGFNYKF